MAILKSSTLHTSVGEFMEIWRKPAYAVVWLETTQEAVEASHTELVACIDLQSFEKCERHDAELAANSGLRSLDK